MKLISVVSCLLVGAATTVLAVPAELSRRDTLSASSIATSRIRWTGAVKRGEPEVTIEGTAEEIYREIKLRNPLYDQELGTSPSSSSSSLLRRAVEKRAPTSDDWTCGYGNDVDAGGVGDGVRALYAIGNGACTAPVGPGACATSACHSGAGIFLCNDMTNGAELSVPCTLVADNAVEVMIHCQSTTYTGGEWVTMTHGQIFSTDRSWNVILNRC